MFYCCAKCQFGNTTCKMFKNPVNIDILSELKAKKLAFDSLLPSEQLAIKENRNKPDLDFQQNEGGTSRRFNAKWYEDYPWLSGSKSLNKLFCVACALYGGEPPWATDGIDILKKFPERANRHQISKCHMKNMELYLMAGKTRRFREKERAEKKEPETDSMRAEILSRIIDIVVVLNRHGKTRDMFSENDKNCAGELVMKRYICDTSLYKQIYTEVNEKLVKTMESQLFMDIKKEISQTEFCSLLIDEIPNRDHEYSVIARYIHDGQVKERFVGLFKIVQIFDLAQVFNNVTGDVRKAVCHSYDGCGAMKPLRLGIKTIMPKLLFLPNHVHKLGTLVLQNLESIDEFKSFIRNVTFIRDFFRAPNRTSYLTKHSVNLSLESETLWRFHSKTIPSILTQQVRLLKIINSIILDSSIVDFETVNGAYHVQKLLHCPIFIMFCSLFTKIAVYLNHLSNTLQKKLSEDVNFCIQEVIQTVKNITNLKTTINIKQCIDENKIRMKKEDITPEKTKIFRLAAFKVLTHMASQIADLFDDLKHLRFIQLFDESKFSVYWNKFPRSLFSETMDFYQNLFDSSRLESELMMIYSDPQKKFNPYQLFCYLHDNELTEVYREIYRLLKLYLTYPLLKIEDGTEPPMVKMRRFLDTPENEDKSAMLYVESYPEGSSRHSDFKKSVIKSLS